MKYHVTEVQKIFSDLNSSEKGLSGQEVQSRLNEYGRNELEEKKKKSPLVLFLGQFKDFMIIVLIAAAIISGLIGEMTDTIIIMVIVVLNAVIGFIQEYRAEKAMEALKKMAMIQATVIREGRQESVSSADLVPGDIVLLEAGNAVPADLRLTEAYSLRIDESALTGESVPADKRETVIGETDIPLGDRLNMAYKSTLVTNGRAKGIVVSTGMKTEIGKIARMLQEEETSTPLQRRMGAFGKMLSYIILAICVVLFLAGWLVRGEEPFNMLMLSISLAVAAIPEALPALITIALAQGARNLVKKNALIRKLPAVETLGSVTFICSDKTGTLTLNKMEVVEVDPFNHDHFYKELPALDCAMALNNDVKKNKSEEMTGDPTEIALVDKFIADHSTEQYHELQEALPRVEELPFDSDRKCMTTIHRQNGSYLAISKGAVESITERLASDERVDEILEKADAMAKNGIRVLAFAYRKLDSIPDNLDYNAIEAELEFIGLVGMIDPPREEAKLAVKECKTAGINVVMITGDHPATAAAIASQIGILTENDLVLTGIQLEKMSEKEFEEKVEKVRVYARVSPEQKLNIVNALQAKDNYVAMTGDGVNDAPSLKTADIGIAMGINGTDVSKESAHMILLDDNFATIVRAVREGRRIYDNIRKFVKYIMTCNGAEILTIALAPLFGLPMPLLPIHILWINLVTDGVPGLALAGEKAEANIMQRPPRKTNESFFARGIGVHILWVGCLMAAITLGIQAWAIHNDIEHWQTMVFLVLSLAQLGHVMAIRSDTEMLIQKGVFSNMPLFLAVFFTALLQLAIVYLPFANELFKTAPLTLNEVLICFGASLLVPIGVEIEKLIRRNMKD